MASVGSPGGPTFGSAQERRSLGFGKRLRAGWCVGGFVFAASGVSGWCGGGFARFCAVHGEICPRLFFGLKSEVFNFFGIIEAWPHED